MKLWLNSLILCLLMLSLLSIARGQDSGMFFISFDFPNARTTVASGINNAGVIVGKYRSDPGGDHGFKRSANGTMHSIDYPLSEYTSPYGLNSAGVIVGQYNKPWESSHGFLLRAGGFISFDYPNGGGTLATAINASGQIVGAYRWDGRDRGFLRDANGNFTPVDYPGVSQTAAFGINDTGIIVGGYSGDLSPYSGIHGFSRKPDGTFSSFDFPDAKATVARGINSVGEIAGYYADVSGNYHGFLRKTDGTFLSIDYPLASSTSVLGVNDLGQIVGGYHNSTGQHAFIATPTFNGIDFSRSAGALNDLTFFDKAKQQGIKVVVAQAWGGRTQSPFADSQLFNAAISGMDTGIYCLLNYDNPSQTGDWQVQQALDAVGPVVIETLRFVGIDVEPIGGEGLPQDLDSFAARNQRILEAVLAVQNAGLQPVIYTSRDHWQQITGNATIFAGLPLWDVLNDTLADLSIDAYSGSPIPWNPYGGWSRRMGKQYDLGSTGNGTTLFEMPVDLDVFDSSMLSLGLSPVSSNVTIQPLDATSGTTPVTLTFSSITQAGTTSLTTSTSGSLRPAGFKTGSPATYYNLTTTAIFSSSIAVCINYSDVSFDNTSKLKLFQFENGKWIDRTTALDIANKSVCATVTSLSVCHF